MSTEERIRESLIALSYTMPENLRDFPEKVTDVGNKTVTEGKGNSGKFRSDLISLSYTLPDDEKLPRS
ncbi:Outer-membrane lipoprotein carrier protein [Bienertia sinuspersici]